MKTVSVLEDESFYRLADLADTKASSLTNDQIDKIIYDQALTKDGHFAAAGFVPLLV
jgi:hypothetical protein